MIEKSGISVSAIGANCIVVATVIQGKRFQNINVNWEFFDIQI